MNKICVKQSAVSHTVTAQKMLATITAITTLGMALTFPFH